MIKFYDSIKLIICILLLFFVGGNVFSQTTSQLGGGIIINEVLADPNGANNFDTDGSGTFDTNDEFIELHNLSGSPIDITGWEIWTGNTFAEHVFASATIPAGGYAVVISGISAGGDIANIPGDVVVVASGSMSLSNTSDVIILYDPVNDEHIKFVYNGNTDTDFETTNSTSILIGSAESTSDSDGLSMSREFDGSTTFVNQTPTPGELNGTPPCTAPTSQASTLMFASVTNNSMDLSWTGGDGDAGVIVLAKEGSAVDADPVSGTTYIANSVFSTGEEIGTGNFVVYVGDADAVSLTGLTQGTDYHFAVYEYNTTDVCYLIPALIGNQSTTTSLDTDSDITAPVTQVAAGTISSVANASGDAVSVFTFTITDSNSGDGQPTLVNSVVIERGANTTAADWSGIIEGAKLSDGTDITVTGVTINATDITFDLVGNEYSVANNSSQEITLQIWLATSVTDQDVLEFEIPTNHSFGANASGSTFVTNLSSSITSNLQTVEVEATDFSFDVNSSVQVSSDFELTVTAVDANGNTDLVARNVTISRNAGTGNLTSGSVGLGALAMTDGVYTWSDLQYDVAESITIDATDDATVTTTSAAIEVFEPVSGVFISEYIEGGGNNKAVEIYNGSGGTIDLSEFVVGLYANGSPTIGNNLTLSDIQPTLADGEVLVISNASSSLAEIISESDITSDITFYNGDDALGLLQNGVLIDVFGEIGNDPGSSWTVGGVSGATANKTLVRKPGVSTGNNVNLSSFGTSALDTEWIILDQDNASDIGSHTVCSAPSVQTSAVNFGATDESSMNINWTRGNGDKALVVMKEGSAVDLAPVSGSDYSTATSIFSDAIVDLGSGNIVVFDGASTDENVTVTGLTQGTTYHVAVFEYNSSGNCFNFTAPANGNNATSTNAVLTVVESITDFGSIDNGNTSASQSFTVEGSGLTTDIEVTAPTYFEVSTDDATYSNSVTLTQSGGIVTTTTVFVRFVPSSGSNSAQGGDLVISTAGATDEIIALTGTETGNGAPYTEDFSSCVDLNGWNAQSVIGAQVWSCTTFGNTGDGAQMSGFQSGVGAQDNEDWLISPSLELTSISALSFWSRAAFPGLSIEVKISSDYTGTGDPTLATWTDLAPTLPAIDSDVWTETAGVDLSSFAGSERYIAFVYYSNPSDGAARWTIDDVTVTNAELSITPPSLTIVESLTDFGSVDNGNSSASQSFTVAGANLTDDITVTAPTNFEVSTDDVAFSGSVILTESGGTVSTTTVFVRFTPVSGFNSVKSGDLTISTTGTAIETVAVSGTESGNAAPVSDLFISEYIEGSSNNKALEVYNNSGAVADLSLYRIVRYNNGSTTASDTLELADIGATLAAGDLIVIANPSASTDILNVADITSEITFYNGDDALRLYKEDQLIDEFGEVGVDPGSAWDVAGGSGVTDGGATAEFTLVRKSSIMAGNPVPLGSFGTNPTDSEWTVFAQDDFSNLGFHVIDGVTSPSLTVTESLIDFGSVDNGSSSTSQSFTVEGADLTADITITATTNFEVSTDDASFSNTVTLTQAGGIVSTTTIFTRFTPTSGFNSVKSGSITISTSGTSSEVIAVSGTETGNAALASDLFISEYIEGSSSNKALEIYNNSGATADLSLYKIVRWNNGSTTASDTLELADISPTLAAGGILVIANPDAMQSILDIADITSEITFYNGDDALRLYKEDAVIDEFGEVGVDPGSAWDVAGGSGVTNGGATANFTLIRKSSITAGNPAPLGSFGTTPENSEWTVLAEDDISNLGFHAIDGVVSPVIAVSGTVNDFGEVTNGEVSTSQSFSVSGTDLNENILVTAPSSFEVSLDDNTFSQSLELNEVGGTVSAVTVFVRFNASSGFNGLKSGNVSLTSSGALTQNVAVSGTEIGNADITPISALRPVDANGNPTALGNVVTIQGTLLGFNSRTTGFQIAINDGTGGLVLRETSGTITTETLTEGDEVEITGTVGFFNGTTQLDNITAVEVLSTGNSRVSPTSVTSLDETTEQELIQLDDVTIDDSEQWAGAANYTGSGFNMNITFNGGSSTGIMRIEDDGDLHLKTFEEVFGTQTTGITLVGIGGQFDDSSPYTEGYQILVYQESDINPEEVVPGLTISETSLDFGDVFVGEESEVSTYTLIASDLTDDMNVSVPEGFIISLDENFQGAFIGDATTPLNIPAAAINGVTATVYVKFVPTTVGSANGFLVHSSTGFESQDLAVSGNGTDPTTGLDELGKYGISVYPNPAEQMIRIAIPESFGSGDINLINLTGKVVRKGTIGSMTEMNVSDLNNGIYILQIANEQTVINHRVVVK
ncbi:lamin tail domain-containing protein [Fulvivirga lutea]|uniref:Lamin tail domain-containing protein n=1 Tax=Fulvivirga lutea TaxID=2810512 RepID=A0A974WFU4_9BACT|nr:lamin tail domain-containing protein [Fulvivirga lutea]QSE96352.1 lamin tail domain-containing protein [Fulvivirga lutea]